VLLHLLDHRPDITHERGFVLDKCARAYVERRLESSDDLCGYERELLENLRRSRCAACGGDGCAPYVGGDDHDDTCPKCDGSGFSCVPEQDRA
jgi:Na+-translocating ferredoxin:NAD+ oxidoreductase RNF subunit RnfB